MKWIKKIFIGLLIIILINLIGILAISFNLKTIIINGVIKETVKQQITSKDYSNGILANEITDNEAVQEILNSQEVQELLNKYLDTVVDGLIDEENLDKIEIEKDMLNFLKENKSVLEEKIGADITDEMIEDAGKQLQEQDMSNAVKQSLSNASRNMSEKEKTVLKGYKFLISFEFKLIVFTLIILVILIIAIIQKSFYKWIKSLGKAMLISGIGLVIISVTVNYIVSNMANIDNFKTTILLNNGIVLIIAGLTIVIFYIIITNIINKNKKEAI